MSTSHSVGDELGAGLLVDGPGCCGEVMGRITGDLLTSRGGFIGGATAGRLRHVPAGATAAGYFAAFFLRSAQ